MQDETSIHIEAPPERVYELVSDLPRMGEWSPECYRCDWLDGWTGPAVGARFRGYNRRGRARWTTTGTVVVADPGREFSFTTAWLGNLPASRWTYRLRLSDGGTELTESYRAPRAGALILLHRWRAPELQQGMQSTLERIKRTAEAEADGDPRQGGPPVG